MLKRVSERKWGRSGLEWPDELKPDAQLFLPRPPLRKLLVMVDAEIEKQVDPSVSLLEQLDERLLVVDLLKHEYIVLYRYADDGPPAGTEGHTVGTHPGLVYPGWVIAEEVDTAEGVERSTILAICDQRNSRLRGFCCSS